MATTTRIDDLFIQLVTEARYCTFWLAHPLLCPKFITFLSGHPGIKLFVYRVTDHRKEGKGKGYIETRLSSNMMSVSSTTSYIVGNMRLRSQHFVSS